MEHSQLHLKILISFGTFWILFFLKCLLRFFQKPDICFTSVNHNLQFCCWIFYHLWIMNHDVETSLILRSTDPFPLFHRFVIPWIVTGARKLLEVRNILSRLLFINFNCVSVSVRVCVSVYLLGRVCERISLPSRQYWREYIFAFLYLFLCMSVLQKINGYYHLALRITWPTWSSSCFPSICSWTITFVFFRKF